MALAKRSLSLPLSCAVGFLALTGANVWAQTPAVAQPSAPPRWEVEIYGGPMLASRSGDGLALAAPDPERFTAFNGRPSAYVPSWYYGYGALMLGAGETVLGQTDRFISDPDCRGLYRLARPAASAAQVA